MRQLRSSATPDRAALVVRTLCDAAPSQFTMDDLARASGLSAKKVAVVLAALEVTGNARRTPTNSALRLWAWNTEPPDRQSSVSSPIQKIYTVKEAADLTGLSEKAIRRRLEREAFMQTDRRLAPPDLLAPKRAGPIYISHRELQDAGLVDNRYPRTSTARNIEKLHHALSRGEAISEANNGGTTLTRAERLMALGAWTEAGHLSFDEELGVWRAAKRLPGIVATFD
jgi:DprA winged helix domain